MTALGHGQISSGDWAQVQQIAGTYHVDPRLLVAIGAHETEWGSTGAGRVGNILGYGAFDSNPNNQQYSGLTAQLGGAAGLLSSRGVHTLQELLGYQQSHGAGVYGATDAAWSNGVAQVYAGLPMSFSGDTSSATAGPVDKKSHDFIPPIVGKVLDPFGVASYLDPFHVVTPTINGAAGVAGAVGSVVGWTEGLSKLLANLSSTAFWIRIGYLAAGSAVTLYGAHLVFGLNMPKLPPVIPI